MALKKISYCFIFITFLLSGICFAQNSLILSDTSVTTNQLFTQKVFLSAEDSIVGFQFDLVLPPSVEFQDSIIISEFLVNHVVSYNEIETGIIRVLCFSLSNVMIPNTDNEIISVLCRSGNISGNFEIRLENATLSNTSSQNVLDQVVNGSLIITGTTNVEDQKKLENSEVEKDGLSVYPNPTNGVINLKYFAEDQKTHILNIYNTLGKKVFTRQLSPAFKGNNQEMIQLSSLASGVYLASINDDKFLKTEKIILLK